MDVIRQALSLILSKDAELIGIIRTTLIMSFFSTAISSIIGLPLGTLLGRSEFRGKKAVMRVVTTLMSLPPVVAGLVVFILFRSVGIFGRFHLMFSVPVMVVAQVILITPVMTGLAASAAGDKAKRITETAKGLGLGGVKQTVLLLKECSRGFVSIALMGFGRSIAEVGAVSLVGGNIQYKTRVMTTAILLEANKGNFDKALATGIILMLISLAVNSVAYTMEEKL